MTSTEVALACLMGLSFLKGESACQELLSTVPTSKCSIKSASCYHYSYFPVKQLLLDLTSQQRQDDFISSWASKI